MGKNPPFKKAGWSRPSNKAPDGFSFSETLGGVLRAVIGVLLMTFLGSAIVYFTDLDERVLGWAVNVGSFLVLGLSSFFTARKAEGYGLLYGLSIGGLYAASTFLVGSVVFPPFLGLVVFAKRCGFALLAGACGGVLGVNS